MAPFTHGLLIELANKYLEIGRSDQAFAILERARRTADAIKDTSLKSSALAKTGTSYAKAGQSHKANELLSEARDAITAIIGQGEPYKSMVLTSVAEEYAMSGFCQQADEISNTITVEHNRSDALTRVAAVCSKGGKTESLKRTPSEIDAALRLLETGEHERGLQAIQNLGRHYGNGGDLVYAATKLAEGGKYDLALEVTRAIVSDGTTFDDMSTVTGQEYRAESVAEITLLYAKARQKEEKEKREFLSKLLSLIE